MRRLECKTGRALAGQRPGSNGSLEDERKPDAPEKAMAEGLAQSAASPANVRDPTRRLARGRLPADPVYRYADCPEPGRLRDSRLPESLSQAILAGIILVEGRLGVGRVA